MYAALKAREAGVDVLLVSKGPIGRSGATPFGGTLLAYLDPKWINEPAKMDGASEEDYASTYFYLADEDHIAKTIQWVRDHLLSELEQMGLYFRRQPDGRVLFCPTRPKHTWTPKMGMSGRVMADLLRRKVLESRIRVMEENMVTSILTTGRRCVGATLFDIMNGEFNAVRAKATIIATGHANFLSRRSTGTREVCGDGLAIPYSAGAELYNVEMVLWHASDMAWPRCWMRLHIYPNPMPLTAETSKIVNKNGEVMYEQKENLEITSPYYLQLKRLYENVRRGKASFDGGYFSDLRHIDPHILNEYSYQTQFPKKVGINPTKDMIENAPSYHFLIGGVWVNFATMASSIPRLFAAGGATGHDGVTECMYDAQIATKSALAKIDELPTPEIEQLQIETVEKRITKLLENAGTEGGVSPISLKRQIREIMWEKMGYVKNEQGMNSALQEFAEIRHSEVPRMTLASKTKRFNYEIVDAFDVYNMLTACELQVRASLYRKESRGPFYREDYPYIDNKNWLKYIILGRKENGEEYIRTEQVSLKNKKLPDREEYLSSTY